MSFRSLFRRPVPAGGSDGGERDEGQRSWPQEPVDGPRAEDLTAARPEASTEAEPVPAPVLTPEPGVPAPSEPPNAVAAAPSAQLRAARTALGSARSDRSAAKARLEETRIAETAASAAHEAGRTTVTRDALRAAREARALAQERDKAARAALVQARDAYQSLSEPAPTAPAGHPTSSTYRLHHSDGRVEEVVADGVRTEDPHLVFRRARGVEDVVVRRVRVIAVAKVELLLPGAAG